MSSSCVLSWSVWSTTVRVVTTDATATGTAASITRDVIEAVDAAASRFRPDSEVNRLAAAPSGRAHAISATLWSLLDTALEVAGATDGLVDPTIAGTLADLGYDRTISAVTDNRGRGLAVQVRRPIGWQSIRLAPDRHAVEAPQGCALDLGATAKAWAADAAAARAADATGCGVLVSLGGDVAVAGPGPDEGWLLRISDDHAHPRDDDPLVVVREGGVATSSTTVRSWWAGRRRLHHIVDPRTARPADGPWRTVTVAASGCVDANAAATAAIILGREAEHWLARRHLPARLVGHDGTVTTVGGWPETRHEAATWVQ